MDERRDFALAQMRKSVEKLGSSAEVTNLLFSSLMHLLAVCSKFNFLFFVFGFHPRYPRKRPMN